MAPIARIVVATRNAKKRAELEHALADLGVEVVSLDAFPDAPDVEETGATFEENAALKARSAARATGLWAVADDSGLCVDALGGRPGVHSARYAGGDAENVARLLEELRGEPPARRGATFVCVLALASPAGDVKLVRGEARGQISLDARGREGFGYDPVFLIPSEGRTYAELGAAYKARESHRARALAALPAALNDAPGK